MELKISKGGPARCAAIYKKSGKSCGAVARKGTLYCRQHQGTPQPIELRNAGAQVYWEKMREALRNGLVETIATSVPLGSKRDPESLRKRSINTKRALAVRRGIDPDTVAPAIPVLPPEDAKLVKKARQRIKLARANLPAIPDKPFNQLEAHEKFAVLLGQSLEFTHRLLNVAADPLKDAKVVSMQKDAAISVMSMRVKIDASIMKERRVDRLSDLLERLKAEPAGPVIDGTVVDGPQG